MGDHVCAKTTPGTYHLSPSSPVMLPTPGMQCVDGSLAAIPSSSQSPPPPPPKSDNVLPSRSPSDAWASKAGRSGPPPRIDPAMASMFVLHHASHILCVSCSNRWSRSSLFESRQPDSRPRPSRPLPSFYLDRSPVSLQGTATESHIPFARRTAIPGFDQPGNRLCLISFTPLHVGPTTRWDVGRQERQGSTANAISAIWKRTQPGE